MFLDASSCFTCASTNIESGETRKNADQTEQADIAIIHFNPTLNDKAGNIERLSGLIEDAFEDGADIVLAPELSTTGYLIK